ncbi:MAG: helix-turn-helix transcriptional regulator [Bacteroidales bacterium]|nr:helix-turn-helix transcriptional regulator [Bacteroidales bacterium]
MSAEDNKGILLSYQERNIIRLIADGVRTADIAKEVGLKPETVKWYRKRLLDTFDASTSAEVVRKAIQYGIL